jgi:hypothetical protein
MRHWLLTIFVASLSFVGYSQKQTHTYDKAVKKLINKTWIIPETCEKDTFTGYTDTTFYYFIEDDYSGYVFERFGALYKDRVFSLVPRAFSHGIDPITNTLNMGMANMSSNYSRYRFQRSEEELLCHLENR